MDTVQQIMDLVKPDIDALKEQINQVNQGGLAHTAENIVLLVPKVVMIVEKATADTAEFSSDDKFEAAARIIAGMFDVPYVPEWLEEKGVRIAIDGCVKKLNDTFGKDWYTKIEPYFENAQGISQGLEEIILNIQALMEKK